MGDRKRGEKELEREGEKRERERLKDIKTKLVYEVHG